MTTLAAPAGLDAEAVFGAHVDLSPLHGRSRGNTRCPRHRDEHPSLSLDLARGVWFCHSCGVGGGLRQFLEFVGESELVVPRAPRDEWALAWRGALRRAELGGQRARRRASIDRASDAIRQYHRTAVQWRALGHRLGPDHAGVWALLDLAASFERHCLNLECVLEALRLERIA